MILKWWCFEGGSLASGIGLLRLPAIAKAACGDAAPYFIVIFAWDPAGVFVPGGGGIASTIFEEPGAILEFQGQTYNLVEGDGLYTFKFGPEVLTWPTSGTHSFTLTLP